MSNKKGEIATILTISSLVFLGAVSLIASVFFKKPIKIQPKASSCSTVTDVSFNPSPIKAGETFTCNFSGTIVNPYTMACGWSKNGGWPQGQQSGRCSGSNCSVTVKMEDNIDPNAVYELVAFDFRNECGPNADGARRVSLAVEGVNPQPSGSNCQGRCCDKPNGYIIQSHVRMDCDINIGRYVIIDKVCQNNQEVDKPSCATCRSCGSGSQSISPVPASDLAVNECRGGCQQNQGVCAGLSDCPSNITPAVIQNCADPTFSCPGGYSSCKKDGVIWCYRGGSGSSMLHPELSGETTPQGTLEVTLEEGASGKTTPQGTSGARLGNGAAVEERRPPLGVLRGLSYQPDSVHIYKTKKRCEDVCGEGNCYDWVGGESICFLESTPPPTPPPPPPSPSPQLCTLIKQGCIDKETKNWASNCSGKCYGNYCCVGDVGDQKTPTPISSRKKLTIINPKPTWLWRYPVKVYCICLEGKPCYHFGRYLREGESFDDFVFLDAYCNEEEKEITGRLHYEEYNGYSVEWKTPEVKLICGQDNEIQIPP